MILKKGDKIEIIKDGQFNGNKYKIGDVLTVFQDYDNSNTILNVTNGVYGGELIMLYETEWKVYEEPSVITDKTHYNGYSVGSPLLKAHLIAWSCAGQNMYNMDPNKWTVDRTPFSSDRIIEKIEQKKDVWAFLVSGTADLWIRADGYREFVESGSKPKVEEVKESEYVFKIGDRVRIKFDTRYYNNTSSNNPNNVTGTVIETDQSSGLKYRVAWDNNTKNSYDYKDLELYEVISYDPLKLVRPDLLFKPITLSESFGTKDLAKKDDVLEFQTPIIITNKKQKRKLVII